MGSLATCCTNRDDKAKVNLVDLDPRKCDLDNKMDLETVLDEYERFKYMFPFYRMNIKVFESKMDKIKGISANSKDTEIIAI